MSRVVIKPATRRDLSFVAANLSDEDQAEIHCQMDKPDNRLIAEMAYQGSPLWRYVAWLDGQPVLAFGVGLMHSRLGLAWAWGTARKLRAFPEATRFMLDVVKPACVDSGINRIHADTLSTHTNAHKWLERLGAHREAVMPSLGLGGETFYRYAWINEE
nr:hypothetical protein [uncultured Cohaesibacter sp.]